MGETQPFRRIPACDLIGHIGKKVHVAGLGPGCVWRLVSVDGDSVLLETPKTKKRMTVKAARLLYTRDKSPT